METRPVPQLELADGEVLLVHDGVVLETFHNGYTRSFRTPALWLAVKAEPRRHDRVRLTVGRAKRGSGQPVYGPEIDFSGVDVSFEIDASEEPGLRAFLDELARAAGR